MTTDQIEQAAMKLLGLYAGRYGMDDSTAIPVDMVVESTLGLTLELDDLSKRLGAQDILGATWIQSKTVVIDQSLEPSENPAMEGRFNFTLAHEAGHWVMHAHQIADIPEQATLFDISTAPSIVCRSSQRKESMEWQADRFASYLLMPEDRIMNFWREIRGGLDQYMAFEEIEAIKAQSEYPIPVTQVAKDMAEHFRVSGQAMQIRLEGLKLILAEQPEPDLFSG
ncbi:MAG: ImmA/IrrE family metallo-endopeptidase [Candidatus Hydrogenedentales bacterium]|jgi:hypothetical protein